MKLKNKKELLFVWISYFYVLDPIIWIVLCHQCLHWQMLHLSVSQRWAGPLCIFILPSTPWLQLVFLFNLWSNFVSYQAVLTKVEGDSSTIFNIFRIHIDLFVFVVHQIFRCCGCGEILYIFVFQQPFWLDGQY